MFHLVEKERKIYISTRTSTFFFFLRTEEKCFLFSRIFFKIYTEYIGYIGRDVKLFIGAKQPLWT